MVRRKRKVASSARLVSLPQCEGAKLAPFELQGASIQWGKRLDSSELNLEEKDAYVFAVKIRSRPFALKVFSFYHPRDTKYYWGRVLGESTPIKDVLPYTDPFFNECRAYGKIHEARSDGCRDKLAVRCHGYLYLSEKDRQWVEGKGLNLGRDVLDDELRAALPGGGKIRAIVKDLAPTQTTINGSNIRKALRVIQKLNNLKVYNRGVRAANFRGGYLVNFDEAWTERHILLDALDDIEANDLRLQDLSMFDEMVETEGIKPSPRALRDDNPYREKLRRTTLKR